MIMLRISLISPAPGADRLEITAFLAKKARDDFNDQNFVQLAEVQNGILRETNTGTDYNFLGDELAQELLMNLVITM